MPDNLLSLILKPVKASFEKFSKKYPKLTKVIGWIIFGVIVLIALISVNEKFKIITFAEKSETEITIEWLEKNFTDSTFNILIFPFNDYVEDTNKNIKIEKAINDRLNEYRRKELYKLKTKSRIRIKFYEEIDPTISSDSLVIIAKKYKTDIVIFGNIYDEPKIATINYIILSESDKWGIFGKEGVLKGIAFKSLYEFREGKILKDLDYITYWIFCNELLYNKDIDAVKDTWNSIERIFTEKIFFNSNAFLTAIIGEFFQRNYFLLDSKEFYKLSLKYRESSLVYNNLGLVYEDLSIKDSAEICFNKALEKDPKNVFAYNNVAGLYINNKKEIEKAEIFLQKALKISGNYGNAYYNLGIIYDIFLINKDLAIKYKKKALTLMPNSSYQILSSIGSTYIDINTDSAKYYLLKAMSLNNTDDRNYNELGVLYNKLGDMKSARKYYFHSLSINPYNATALNNIGNLYKKSDSKLDSAIYYYKKSIAADENYYLPYYNMGVIYYQKYKNYKLAKYYFQKSLSLNKYYTDSYLYLGQIYLNNERQQDSAYICFEKAIKYKTKSAGVYNNCAVLLKNKYNNYDLAENYFKEAILLDPKLAEAYSNYAYLLLYNLKNPAKAKEYYNISIKLNENLRDKKLDEYFKSIK